MKRRLVVAFAVFAALLVVSATPANAAQLAVASEHTTESEFNSGSVPDGYVIGSGDSASVSLGDGVPDTLPADGIGLSAVVGPSADASYISQPFTADRSTIVEIGFYLEENEADGLVRLRLAPDDGSGNPDLNNVLWSSGIVDVGAEQYYNVSIPGGETVTQGDTYHVVVDGTASAGADGSLDTTLSTSGQSGRRSNDGGSTWSDASFGDAYASSVKYDGGAGETYLSINHSVDRPEQTWANLSLDNATATVTWESWTGSSWAVVASSTESSTGNYTYDVPDTANTLRVNISTTETAGDSTAVLHDEGVLFEPSAPSVTDVSPADGAFIDESKTLSATITDRDFDAAQGDSVTVDFVVDGSTVGTDTLSSNGTASTSWTPSVGGTLDYLVRANDSYGQTAATQPTTLQIPAELIVKNESDPGEILTSASGSADVSFYASGEDRVYSRPIENGRVDMTGLPADETLVAVVQADGYITRRVIVDSILQQQSVYLLPETATKADIIYSLDDQTGRFEGNGAQLVIQKAINESGDVEYRNIVGDRFGATGEVAVTLESDQRYRLRVRNDDGESRVLGTYVTAGDDPDATLPIGRITLTSDIRAGTAFDAAIINPDSDPAIRIVYRDPASTTGSLDLEVTDENGTLIRPNTTHVGPYGRYIETYALNESPEGHTYTVRYRATNATAVVAGGSAQVGDVAGLADDWNIDGEILSLLGWVTVFASMGLTVLIESRLAAIVGPVVAGGLTVMSVINPPWVVIAVGGGVGLLFFVGGGE